AGLNVNSFTGNVFYQRNDIDIPGMGPDLSIHFSYNDRNISDDFGYGFGWTFTYSNSYTKDSAHLTITRGDGRKDTFTLSGSVYAPPAGTFDSLFQYQPGKYSLKNK